MKPATILKKAPLMGAITLLLSVSTTFAQNNKAYFDSIAFDKQKREARKAAYEKELERRHQEELKENFNNTFIDDRFAFKRGYIDGKHYRSSVSSEDIPDSIELKKLPLAPEFANNDSYKKGFLKAINRKLSDITTHTVNRNQELLTNAAFSQGLVVKNQLLFSPLQLFDIYGGIQLGLNHKLSSQLSWQNSVAYLFYPFFRLDAELAAIGEDPKAKISGFSYKTELKYYLKNKESLSGMYTAPELLFKYVEIKRPYESGTTIMRDAGVHVKFGYTKYLNKTFFFDTYAGLGFRWKKSSFPGGIDYEPSSVEVVLPSAALGFKIGWVLP